MNSMFLVDIQILKAQLENINDIMALRAAVNYNKSFHQVPKNLTKT